jgi:hypothetical protein
MMRRRRRRRMRRMRRMRRRIADVLKKKLKKMKGKGKRKRKRKRKAKSCPTMYESLLLKGRREEAASLFGSFDVVVDIAHFGLWLP